MTGLTLQDRIIVSSFRHLNSFSRLFSKSPPPPSRTLTIPSSSHGGAPIKLLIRDPPSSSGAPNPVHITFHGSGYVSTSSLGSNGAFCAYIAHEAECVVIDADYRKAPEHPFPAAVDDAMTVVNWVLSGPAGEQFDKTKVSVGGFSAGANVALAVFTLLPVDTLVASLALYPPTDWTVSYDKKPAPPPGKPEAGTAIPVPVGTAMRDAYVGSWEDMADVRLSPIFADPICFPGPERTLVVTCEYDYLRDEGRRFGENLREGGRQPVCMDVLGVGHGWDTSAKEGTTAGERRDEVYVAAVHVLRRGYDLSPAIHATG